MKKTKMENKKLQNYEELKVYLEESDEPEATAQNLKRVLKKELSFSMLDVGCSNGKFTLSIIPMFENLFPKFRLVGVEPEKPAIQEFKRKIKERKDIKLLNLTIQDYLKKSNSSEIFDYIQFSQNWYHFPKEDWNFIIDEAFSLLRKKGIIVIILDSHKCEAYKLKDLITDGKADTLEFGDLHAAEDIEIFLREKNINFETTSFPIYLKVEESENKLLDLARHLAFLYRTNTKKIFDSYKRELGQMLKRNKKEDNYLIENKIKIMILKK